MIATGRLKPWTFAWDFAATVIEVLARAASR